MADRSRVLPGDLICLPSQDPLLCAPDEKAPLEAANSLAQLEYIEHLAGLARESGQPFQLRESHVRDLQRLAVDGIYPCAGRYRSTTRTAEISGGGATHRVPEPALVEGLVREAIDRLNGDEWIKGPAPKGAPILRAAYALWRFNWIHPFAGGNGRTSRAVTYLLFCVDFGGLVPGEPSFPTLIWQRRDRYIQALREADDAESRGTEDLRAMSRLVGECLLDQLRSTNLL